MEVTAISNEFRRYISHGEFMPMLSKLRDYTKNAPFTDDRGRYHMRTLYFGKKRMRVSRLQRESEEQIDQFYIRYYNNDISTLNVVKTSSLKNKIMKAFTPITADQYQKIIDHDIIWMDESGDELLRQFYERLTVQDFVTKNVIDNDRIALVCHYNNNVRICVDLNIRTTNRSDNFLSKDMISMPLDGSRTLVLKVKYENQLPEPIFSIVGCNINE